MLECGMCGHKWRPRVEVPKKCPKCYNPIKKRSNTIYVIVSDGWVLCAKRNLKDAEEISSIYADSYVVDCKLC